MFDLHRPGRDFKLHSTVKDKKEGQTGSFLIGLLNCYYNGCKKMAENSVTQTDSNNSVYINAGIISALAFSPSHTGMLALGSYSQTTAIYTEDNMELLYVLHGQEGGVTHVSLVTCNLYKIDSHYKT